MALLIPPIVSLFSTFLISAFVFIFFLLYFLVCFAVPFLISEMGSPRTLVFQTFSFSSIIICKINFSFNATFIAT